MFNGPLKKTKRQPLCVVSRVKVHWEENMKNSSKSLIITEVGSLRLLEHGVFWRSCCTSVHSPPPPPPPPPHFFFRKKYKIGTQADGLRLMNAQHHLLLFTGSWTDKIKLVTDWLLLCLLRTCVWWLMDNAFSYWDNDLYCKVTVRERETERIKRDPTHSLCASIVDLYKRLALTSELMCDLFMYSLVLFLLSYVAVEIPHAVCKWTSWHCRIWGFVELDGMPRAHSCKRHIVSSPHLCFSFSDSWRFLATEEAAAGSVNPFFR